MKKNIIEWATILSILIVVLTLIETAYIIIKPHEQKISDYKNESGVHNITNNVNVDIESYQNTTLLNKLSFIESAHFINPKGDTVATIHNAYYLYNANESEDYSYQQLELINSKIKLINIESYPELKNESLVINSKSPILFFDTNSYIILKKGSTNYDVQAINNFLQINQPVIMPNSIQLQIDSLKKIESGAPKKAVAQIKTKKYIQVSESIPNLYRASIVTGKSVDYLKQVNNLKNNNVVIGQKIYYE